MKKNAKSAESFAENSTSLADSVGAVLCVLAYKK